MIREAFSKMSIKDTNGVESRISRFDEARRVIEMFRIRLGGRAYQMESYTLDQYQMDASRTARYPDRCGMGGLTYTSLGLGSEAGEVQGKVKKLIRDKGSVISDEDREALAQELGDVLWYTANTALELGYSLSDIAEMNRDKLLGREVRGTIQGNGDNR